VKEKGKPAKLVQRTGHHEDGDRPRDASGHPLNAPQPVPPKTKQED
jgi:hypothetical protein